MDWSLLQNLFGAQPAGPTPPAGLPSLAVDKDPRAADLERAMLWSAYGQSLAGGTPFFQAVGQIQQSKEEKALKQLELMQKLQDYQLTQQSQDILAGREPLGALPLPGMPEPAGAIGAQAPVPGLPEPGLANIIPATDGSPEQITVPAESAPLAPGQLSRVGPAMPSPPMAGPVALPPPNFAAPVAPAAQLGQAAAAAQPGLPTNQQASTPAQMQAERYRQLSRIWAVRDPNKAKAYADMADKMDPVAKWGAPQAVTLGGKTVLAQFDDKGNHRIIEGAAPYEALPSDIRALEYVTGGSLAGTGAAGVGQIHGYRKAGATNVTNMPPGGKTLVEGIAGDVAKTLPTKFSEANVAVKGNEALDKIIAYSRAGTFSGPLANGAVGAAQFLGAFGVTVAPDMLSRTRLTDANINIILGQLMSALGARGLTDKDMEILRGQLPRVADDPNSRVLIAQTLKAANNRTIEEYNRMRDSVSRMNVPGMNNFLEVYPTLKGSTPGKRPLSEIIKPPTPNEAVPPKLRN